MRLNAIMALATVASVVGVMGSATVGSLSVRHHYFQGAAQGGSAHHGVPVEVTSQLTGGEELPPLAFVLLSDLARQPALADLGRQGQSDPARTSGDGPMTSQFLSSAFGGGGFGALAAGQDAASASNVVQTGLPNTPQLPEAPAAATSGPGAPASFGGAGFFAPPPPVGPGPPPTVEPPVLVLPPVPPLLPVPPPPVPIVAPPQQDGVSPGPPPTTSAIPEPATWFLLVLGLGLIGAMMPGRRHDRRRREPFPLTMDHREGREGLQI